ncbi:helix-turn-helix transcriptional regulator [Acidaminococcus fermentans]|uniref:helix-turn-helix transcriptional regulator n=1 Tax=Acidaminococcus fermentans TaxID=905 RepID=UPI003D01F96C
MKISLKAARVNAGLTQLEVAKKLRKNKQTIVNWEMGRNLPDVANFAALCSLYGADGNEIFLPKLSAKSEPNRESKRG